MAHREPMQANVMFEALKQQTTMNDEAIRLNRLFKNSNLRADIEKLLSYDEYSCTDFTTDYDIDLGYILDIKDNSYFYSSEQDRDKDYREISILIENKFEVY